MACNKRAFLKVQKLETSYNSTNLRVKRVAMFFNSRFCQFNGHSRDTAVAEAM